VSSRILSLPVFDSLPLRSGPVLLKGERTRLRARAILGLLLEFDPLNRNTGDSWPTNNETIESPRRFFFLIVHSGPAP